MPISKKVFTFKQPEYLRKKVNKNLGIYVKRYLPLGVFTFLPTGLLPDLVRIVAKFREISQICE